MDETTAPASAPEPAKGSTLDAAALAAWRARVDAGKRARKPHEKEWDANLDAYQMKGLKTTPTVDTVVVPKDYANTNQKLAQLFFQTPEVQALPLSPLMDGKEDAVLMFQTVLNAQLGSRGANVGAAVDQVGFDLLCPAGIGAVKIGYEAVTVDRPQPVRDPMGQLVPDLKTDPTGRTPLMEIVPVPKREKWFWERFSPKKLVIPHDFHGNDFDDAPWLGMQFTKPEAVVRREYKIPKDVELKTVARDEAIINADSRESVSGDSTDKLVEGIEIWYQAAIYDADVLDPLRYKRLVLLDGLDDQPAAWGDSPYQVLDPDGFVDDTRSMIGNPIHVVTLRVMSDTAWQPSDCTITRILVNEMGKFRTQTVQLRDTNKPMRFYDSGIVTPDVITKMQTAPGPFGLVGLPPGMLNAGNPPVQEVAKATDSRENWKAQDYIDRDISEAWAMSSNQRSVQEEEGRTATEVQTMQANADVRLDKERGRLLAWFLKGVEQKFAPLLVRFYDPPDLVQVIGEAGAMRWMQWDKQKLSIKWAFSAKPDSQIRVDAARDRKQSLDLYQLLANEPHVNRVQLVDAVLRRHNLDPTKIVVAQPPEKGPEPPKVSYAFKSEDVLSPAAPIVFKLLTGDQITPDDIASVQTLAAQFVAAQNAAAYAQGAAEGALDGAKTPSPQHGGAAQQAEPLSKHHAAQTGGMQGSGGFAPMGAGGVM